MSSHSAAGTSAIAKRPTGSQPAPQLDRFDLREPAIERGDAGRVDPFHELVEREAPARTLRDRAGIVASRDRS